MDTVRSREALRSQKLSVADDESAVNAYRNELLEWVQTLPLKRDTLRMSDTLRYTNVAIDAEAASSGHYRQAAISATAAKKGCSQP